MQHDGCSRCTTADRGPAAAGPAVPWRAPVRLGAGNGQPRCTAANGPSGPAAVCSEGVEVSETPQWRAELPLLATISAGGALGAVLRYGVGEAIGHSPDGFAWATLTVNVVGCLSIGVLMGVVTRVGVGPLARPFPGTGLLGGLTTFSTYVADVQPDLQAGEAGDGGPPRRPRRGRRRSPEVLDGPRGPGPSRLRLPLGNVDGERGRIVPARAGAGAPGPGGARTLAGTGPCGALTTCSASRLPDRAVGRGRSDLPRLGERGDQPGLGSGGRVHRAGARRGPHGARSPSRDPDRARALPDR